MRIEVEKEPSQADIAALVAALGDGLSEHTLPLVGSTGFKPLAVIARGDDGTLAGGAYGLVNWEWVQISLLWVGAEHRGAGLGSALLKAIEAAASERGCRNAHLDTFSFQARPFYERHGYAVFAEIEDYPRGHSRYFLRKRLDGRAIESGA